MVHLIIGNLAKSGASFAKLTKGNCQISGLKMAISTYILSLLSMWLLKLYVKNSIVEINFLKNITKS